MKDFTASDLILEGLAYTVMGMLVVFAVLIIIMLVIKAMALFSKEEAAPAPEAVPVPEAAPAPEAAAASAADESELVAVITAAVAAAMQTSPSGLLIRSYKKVSGTAWNNAGRRETLENRF